eukprot:CAMPEP_0171972058 /NCGR_PEP_ID=MMETSP0993-20121228/220889_1 /TAXON_ID=483369 /ORGANISM="non described non described, Strain CCMP2098" /LENGTH=101 /DNA_ID=CAMNT_0012622525 /DNA_START=183 /DNA_END=488 /DNA_ORIENTATION=+
MEAPDIYWRSGGVQAHQQLRGPAPQKALRVASAWHAMVLKRWGAWLALGGSRSMWVLETWRRARIDMRALGKYWRSECVQAHQKYLGLAPQKALRIASAAW